MNDEEKTKAQLIEELAAMRQRIAELEASETDRKRAEEALEETDRKHQRLLDNAFDAVYLLQGRRYEYVNPSFCQMTGYSYEELTSSDFDYDVMIPPEMHQFFEERYQARMRGVEIPNRYEVRLARKDGKPINVEVTTVSLGEEGKPLVLGIMRDITDRKRADEAIIRAKKEWEHTFDTIPDMIAIIDNNYRIVRVNRAMAERLEATPAECVGLTCYEVIHGLDAPSPMCPHALSLIDGKEHHAEVIVEQLGCVFDVTASPLNDSEGNVVGSVHVAHDITERKRADEATREREALLQTIFHVSPTGIGLVRNRELVWVNERIAEMLGYAVEELNGQSARMLYQDETEYERVGDVKYAQIRETGIGAVETRMISKNGNILNIYLQSAAIDPKDLSKGLIFTITDITDRKRTEEELRRYEHIVSSSTDMMALLDDRFVYLAANKTYRETFGLNPDELIGHTISEIFGEKFFNEVIKPNAVRCLAGEEVNFQGWIEFPKYGKVYMDVHYYPYISVDNEVLGFVVNARDITERKRTVEVLREREQLLQDIFESIQDGISILNIDLTVRSVNGTTKQWYAANLPLEGKKCYECYHNSDHPCDPCPTLRCIESGETETDIVPGLPGSCVEWIELFSYPMKDSVSGEVTGIVEFARDVTELKRTEKLQDALYRISQASETAENLDELFQAVHRIIQDVMTADNFYIALYDDKVGMLNFPYFVDKKGIVPTSRKLGRGITEYVLRTGRSLLCSKDEQAELERRGEFQIFGGFSEIWLGVPLKIEGETIGVIAVQSYSDPNAYTEREQDMLEYVSEQVAKAIEHKRADDALLESEEKLRNIVENSTNLFYSHTVDHILTYLSPQVIDVLGYTPEEAMVRWTELTSDNPINEIGFQLTVKAIETGKPQPPYELELIHKSGRKVYAEIREAPVVVDGITIAIVGAMTDITERKLAEKELRRSEKRYQQLVEMSPYAIVVHRRGKILFINRAGVDMIRASSREEVIGMPVIDFIHPDYREIVTERIQKLVMQGDEAPSMEAKFICLDGTIIDVETSAMQIIYDGEPAVQVVIQDITDRKRAETDLQANEEQMRLMVQNLPVMADATDENGNIILWNQECERVTGYSAEEIIGNPRVWEILIPDREYRDRVRTQIKKQGRNYRDWEWELTAKDGSKRIISWSYISDIIPIPGWAEWGIGIDVTELVAYRERMEQLVKQRTEELELAMFTIRESKERIDTILNSVGDGLIVFDTDNRVILMNPAAEKLLGVQLHETFGKQLNADIVINSKMTLNERIHTVLKKNKHEYEFDFEMPTADPKESRIVHAKTSIITDNEGKRFGVVVIIRDVTVEREIDRQKSTFISDVAHELRTPLTSIVGFSELLQSRSDFTEEQQKGYLSVIHNESKVLSDIINELLDISRIEAGEGLALNKTVCTPQDCFGLDIDSYHVLFPTHHFELILYDSDVELFIDKGKILQVFKNIIGNAVKYSPDGGLIRITGEVKGEHYVLSIEDQGIGMTPEQLARIFEKFYRADPSNTAIEGTGLGMTLTKHLVEMHGGQIWLESEFGKGTTVRFTIPIIPENFNPNGHTD